MRAMSSASFTTHESHRSQYPPLTSPWTSLSPSHSQTDMIVQNYGSQQASSPVSLSREPSFPHDGFSDLHVSCNEPKIFPGVISRSQRRGSLAKERNSFSESDDPFAAAKRTQKSGGQLVVDPTIGETRPEQGDADEGPEGPVIN